MWTRKELKVKARTSFKLNYWKCVLVSFILVLIGGAGGSAGGSAGGNMSASDADALASNPYILQIIAAFAIVGVVATLLQIFVFSVLEVGGSRFYIENSKNPANIGTLGYGFSSGRYGTIVGSMFLTGLFTFFWTLLFIIPGLVKAYAYRMVPYILADNPEISAVDAITLSRQMMKGNKWKSFVLDLSFIGWGILSVITLGIVGLLYVNPYIHATNAELYLALKDESTF